MAWLNLDSLTGSADESQTRKNKLKMSVTATAKSFRKTIGFSLLGGIAFTLLQACWPITSQSFGATSGPATSTLGLAGEGGADPIDAEINAARAKLKAAEDELTKAKDVETEAKKLTPPETPANKLKKDEAGKALETAEKTVADHKQTLKNAEDAKRLKMEANKSDPRLPWVWRFLANTGLVFSLQLVVFLSQQKEMAGILRVFAEQIGIKWNEPCLSGLLQNTLYIRNFSANPIANL